MKLGNIIKRQKREENKGELNQEMWVRFYIEYKTGVSIIDSIPHCNTENNLKRGKNQEMWLHYYIENKTGISIIDSIQQSRTENALERDKNQEMWLRSI